MANLCIWVPLLITSNVWIAEGKNRTKLRVTTGDVPLALKVVSDSNGKLLIGDSILGHFIDWLTVKLDFEYTITKYYRTDSSVLIPPGTLINGSWNGVMGDITKDVADIAVGAFGLQEAFVHYADILNPWTMSTYSMYIPYPGRDDTIWAFLKPFTVTVWLLLLISIMGMSFTIWAILSLSVPRHNKKGSKRFSYDTIVMSLIAVLSAQGGYWNCQGKRQFQLGMTWCLASLVIVNAYNGLLTSYLSATTPHLLINSLEDLASKPHVNFYTFVGSWSYYTLTKAETGARKILRERFLTEPERLVPSIPVCMGKVDESSSVCFMESAVGDKMIESKFKQTKKCSMTYVERGFLTFNPGFIMRKNHPLFSKINQGIMWANDYGLGQYWQNLFYARRNYCKLQTTTSTNKEKISMRNLLGPFVMLVFGSSVALFVFLLEVYRYNYKKGTLGLGVKPRKVLSRS